MSDAMRTVRIWTRPEGEPKIVGGEEPAAWARVRAAGEEPHGELWDLQVPVDLKLRRFVVRRFRLARRLQDLKAKGETLSDVAKQDPSLAVELMGLEGVLEEVTRG